ncbi:MAG: hypothetical protein Q4G67_04905 [Actinomycetia bacterium]|nr:hypothetical protein [Actinomycetes bacterium]
MARARARIIVRVLGIITVALLALVAVYLSGTERWGVLALGAGAALFWLLIIERPVQRQPALVRQSGTLASSRR